MRLTIARPSGYSLDKYRPVLDKFDFRMEESSFGEKGSIEVNSIEELKIISDEIGRSLVMWHCIMFGDKVDVMIYDTYIE